MLPKVNWKINIVVGLALFAITSSITFICNFFFLKYPDVEARTRVLEEKFIDIDNHLKEIRKGQENIMYFLLERENETSRPVRKNRTVKS